MVILRDIPPPERSPRWKRRKEARPSEILEAALAAFTEKGLAGARMDDIARRAGVTKGTLYLYFKSKDDLFRALLSESFGERLRFARDLVDRFDGSSAELLATILRVVGDFVATTDHVALPKLVIGEIQNFPELHRFYREEVIDRGMGVWSAILERGIARGEFRPVAVEHVIRICIAPVLLAAIWRTLFESFDDEPYDVRAMIETHIDILLRGLAPEGEKR
ncbi:MAG TPA: TetR/AcrR family transcriptional regulator [Rhizomicrobium sp.]|jgi:AcrR family transcriptional regulator